MRLKVETPPGWDSLDRRVLFEAEVEAERFAAKARFAFSIAVAAILLALSLIVGRFSEWVALIALANIAISTCGVVLARAAVLPRILPWIGVLADALLLFGIGWFGPWLESLPPGLRSALVSPWGAFLLLAVTSLGLNTGRLVLQTILLALAVGLLIWWPASPTEPSLVLDPRLELLFTDGSNAMRLGIILLTGMAMALAASRARRTLMVAIRSARDKALLERFNSAEINRYVLSSDVEKLRSGARQRVCILFADIRGFTNMSQSLDPSRVVTLLNSFRARAERAVTTNGGAIDKFIGDGLLAIFGLASPRNDDARNAMNAAIMLAAAVEKWSQKRVRNGRSPIEVSIGVHVGDVFVGLLGEERYEFTAIGDAVNVGQRLQAACRDLGTSIVVSAELFDEAPLSPDESDMWVRHEALQLRGRDGHVDVYIYRSLEDANTPALPSR